MADRRAEGWGDQAARSVLLVEDDALLRDLMARELERHGFRIETAANAIEAKRAFDARDHDALILDINLGPGATGFDLAEIIRAESPYAAIVFLTDVPDPRFIGRELGDVPLGVAYVRKSGLQNLDAVVAALDRVLRGEGFWAARDDRDPNRPFATLTRGQVFVARLIAQGLSNAQIAEVRGVTVKSAAVMRRR